MIYFFSYYHNWYTLHLYTILHSLCLTACSACVTACNSTLFAVGSSLFLCSTGWWASVKTWRVSTACWITHSPACPMHLSILGTSMSSAPVSCTGAGAGQVPSGCLLLQWVHKDSCTGRLCAWLVRDLVLWGLTCCSRLLLLLGLSIIAQYASSWRDVEGPIRFLLVC